MKMKRVKLFILMFVTGIFVTTSCKFGDINVDPNAIAQAQLKDQLPLVIGQTVFNNGASNARACGLIMQHYLGLEAQQQEMGNYVFSSNTFNNLWSFGLYGAGAMTAADVLIKQATEEEQPYYIGIGKILMAVNLGTATQSWGDVPYSQAFLATEGEEFFQPEFDTQESLYNTVQQLLDEAIIELSKPAIAGGPGSDDLMYDGDASAWIKTANALKARYYMHLVKRDGAAHTKALNVLSSAYASNAEESMFTSFGSQGANDANPYGQFGAQRPNTLVIWPGFSTWLDDNSDPRKPLYMANDGTNDIYYTAPDGLFWSSYTSPLPIISYTEQLFLFAEALLRNGDAGLAENTLADAITANMEQMGIASADYAAYVADRGSFGGLTSDAERLERIIEEKYVALYAQGMVEIWTDYRRTGYPALTPNPDGVNGVNPSGVIPRRWIYPNDEKFSNTANVDAAIARQGGELLDDDMWAFAD
jgi:hypothetical protein